MPKSKKELKGPLLEALYNHKCIVKNACAAIGIDRKTYNNWCRQDAEFKENVDLVFEDCADMVREAMLELALTGQGGHFPSMKYILETKFLRRRENETLSDIVNNMPQYIPTAVDFELMKAYMKREDERNSEEGANSMSRNNEPDHNFTL